MNGVYVHRCHIIERRWWCPHLTGSGQPSHNGAWNPSNGVPQALTKGSLTNVRLECASNLLVDKGARWRNRSRSGEKAFSPSPRRRRSDGSDLIVPSANEWRHFVCARLLTFVGIAVQPVECRERVIRFCVSFQRTFFILRDTVCRGFGNERSCDVGR